MGTVFVPTFYPRWRVRYVLTYEGVATLYGAFWWRTQHEAEHHALNFLEGVFPCADLYDIQHEESA